jgi:predicted small lipoprotein YifL
MRVSLCCLVIVTATLVGCGQKGPLVRPSAAHPPVPAGTTAAPETPAPAAAPAPRS